MPNETFTPAGAYNQPGDFDTFVPDLAKITKNHMVDAIIGGGNDLAYLLMQAAKFAAGDIHNPLFTVAERETLRSFVTRGNQTCRWKRP